MNPFQTRKDLQRAVVELTDPLEPWFSLGSARLTLGDTGAHYTQQAVMLEAFARPLWGLIPLLAGRGETPLIETYLMGIKNGTNPEHPEYWGQAADFDQMLVEMAVFGFLMALLPHLVHERFDAAERARLAAWVGQINRWKLGDNNWLFFGVLVNLGLKTSGMPFDQAAMDAGLDRLETFVLPGGWYSDGPTDRRDYYVPFALHFYGLIYAKLAEQDDPQRSARFKARAEEFARDFISWFAQDGSAIPYGRSLAYRFAQGAFWSALVFAGVEAFPLGVLKGLIFRHLRWWWSQPIFDRAGLLTIGYSYSNLNMTEYYNAPGSPHWADKIFLILALPADHPFWLAKEEPLPPLPEVSVQEQAHMLVTRLEGGRHVVALCGGQNSEGAENWLRHGAAKYQKFAYSTAFGFSVPSSDLGAAQGAYDSMLALSDDGIHFRAKERTERLRIKDGVLLTVWQPFADVTIETWLLPLGPWHARVHHISTGRDLHTSEGGFSLPREKNLVRLLGDQVSAQGSACRVSAPWGFSGIVALERSREGLVLRAAPNTNVIHSQTFLPSVSAAVKPGTHWLATAVLAGLDTAVMEREWTTRPQFEVRGDRGLLIYQGREIRLEPQSTE